MGEHYIVYSCQIRGLKDYYLLIFLTGTVLLAWNVHECPKFLGLSQSHWVLYVDVVHHAINRGSYFHYEEWGLYMSPAHTTPKANLWRDTHDELDCALHRSRGAATTKGSSRIKAKFWCWGRNRKHACQQLLNGPRNILDVCNSSPPVNWYVDMDNQPFVDIALWKPSGFHIVLWIWRLIE